MGVMFYQALPRFQTAAAAATNKSPVTSEAIMDGRMPARENHRDRDPAHGGIRQCAVGSCAHRCRFDRAGETFYGAGAVEAQIHDTFAGRLLGRDPLHIEAIHRDMLNLPMAQSSTGVEYRAASAIDIALWDLFGKACHQPVHQMLGGLCRDKQRIYNTCAGYKYVRSTNIRPVSNWSLGQGEGPYEDLDGFMNRADALAESLLESGISAMKIWPFDPAA